MTIIYILIAFVLGYFAALIGVLGLQVGTFDTDESTGECLIEFNDRKSLNKTYYRKYLLFKNKRLEKDDEPAN